MRTLRVPLLAVLLWLPTLSAQTTPPAPPTPRSVLGFEVGADRTLADWPQILGYFTKLAAASPAVKMDTLGPTTMGKPFVLVTISTPENVRRLDAIRTAQAHMADPRTMRASDEARYLASQPSVILISCNIHSDEIASSQMAMELAYRLATNDTLQHALANTVVLLIPSMNPDGEQMIVEWYRKELGTKWEGGDMPWLYHKYVGHDNNRDWFMVTQQETKLVTDLLYRRWFPEVFYDVHQMGAEGARLFVPPFLDPVNPNVDPLIIRGIGQIGAEMAMALQEQGKQGVADRAIYDVWWHGGARSTPTRHNMIGLLTEAASVKVATPITQTAKDLTGHERGLPKYERTVSFPDPWPGGEWKLRDIVDYELIAAEALVKLAADHRADYVRDFIGLGRREVAMGESDTVKAWLIPRQQRDPFATQKMLDLLRAGGVEISEQENNWVVSMAQPYRAHAKDLLEVQHYPRKDQWPGGPPDEPYDVTGWTLPLQMGVRAIPSDTAPRIDTRFGAVIGQGGGGGGMQVVAGKFFQLFTPGDSRGYAEAASSLRQGGTAVLEPSGAILAEQKRVAVNGRGGSRRGGLGGGQMRQQSSKVGGALPEGIVLQKLPRIALYKPWTANIDEGWTRWVLEQFQFKYASVTDSVIRAGNLRDHFDALIVPDMSMRELRDGMPASEVPPQYAGGLGATGIAALTAFVRSGGTLVLLDRASELATESLGVPVKRITVSRALSRRRAPGDSVAPSGEPLFAPGSILRVLMDTSRPVGYGMPDTAAVYFTNSTTFDVAAGSPVRVIARYPERAEDILLSGYLQGAGAIAGKAAAVEAPVGEGRVVMFGFRVQHRGQTYGTFRMLFNALLASGHAPTR